MKDKPPTGHPDRRAPTEIPSSEQLPLINSLPNGTNVVIIDGRPKQPPWTIKDVEPRHHLMASFERLPYGEQLAAVSQNFYCPYDIHGIPVILKEGRDEEGRPRLRHVFKNEDGWKDPVVDNVRTDDPREQARRNAALRKEVEMARGQQEEGGRRSASGMGARERRRESGSARERERESGSAPGSSHGRREGGGGGGSGGGFTAVNR